MPSKQLAILAALVVATSAAFAQTTAANLPNTTPVANPAKASLELRALPPIWVGPALHAPGGRQGSALGAGTANSYNWDGYVVTGTNFTSAKGSWVVPGSTCGKSPDAMTFFWVGIDGWGDNTVEQIGTAVACEKTTPVYFAWYEFYPASSISISTVPIKPGDTISGQVTYKSSAFTLKITDETTGQSFSITQAATANRTSAEWIAEAPTVVTGIVSLADFAKVSFGDDATGIAGSNAATDSAHSGPISAFGSSVLKVTEIDWLNYNEATPSALSADGTSFTSTWHEPF